MMYSLSFRLCLVYLHLPALFYCIIVLFLLLLFYLRRFRSDCDRHSRICLQDTYSLFNLFSTSVLLFDLRHGFNDLDDLCFFLLWLEQDI